MVTATAAHIPGMTPSGRPSEQYTLQAVSRWLPVRKSEDDDDDDDADDNGDNDDNHEK